MSEWSNSQLQLLRDNLSLPPDIVCGFYTAAFGNDRSYDAIARQFRRLKAATEVQALVERSLHIDDAVEKTESKPDSSAEENLRKSMFGSVVPKPTEENKQSFQQFVDDLIAKSSRMIFNRAEGMQSAAGSSLCVLLSDTHIGKHTDSFNKEVFVQRLLSIPDMFLDQYGTDDTIEEVVLLLIGDMLEGEGIYETQAHHIEMVALDQIKIAVDTIWKVAQKFNSLLDVPVRIITCPGNHGRVSKTSSEKTNYDNIIYQTLGYIAEHDKDSNITVDVNFESFYSFTVQDKTGMMFHHGTKHLGTPAMQSKVAGWIHTKQFDFAVHGHWHHWEVGSQFGRIVMKNGSLPGDDDLSERMGVYDPPRQGWIMVRNGIPISQMGFFEWSNNDSK